MAHDEISRRIELSFTHRVIFTEGAFSRENPLLEGILATDGPGRGLLVVDSGVVRADPAVLSDGECYLRNRASVWVAPPVVVPGGEDCKRDSRAVRRLVRAIHDAKLCRHSYVVAVGGGAVLDAAGLAASLVHRGVRLVRLPTTVLAQADAGIGVKNGIDYRGQKNFLGTFDPPHAVINDRRFLRTLDPATRRDGMAEAVKVALLLDRGFFEWIEAHVGELRAGEPAAVGRLIRRCAELHLDHIAGSGDPFERGSARPLDFGHWAAHRLERLSDFSLSHGCAVAVGMAIDVAYSRRIGALSEVEAGRIGSCLRELGFDLAVGERAGIRREADLAQLLQGIREFREHLGGRLSVALLSGIGRAFQATRLDEEVLAGCAAGVLLPKPGYSASDSEALAVVTFPRTTTTSVCVDST